MADLANILVVSDLHFGEQLLPGASVERHRAVELAETAFREFLRYHAVRRRNGRPWRLVIAGDLFDFMSVVIPASKEFPARGADERRHGLGRGIRAGVLRMAALCEAHRSLLGDLVRFAAAGHSVDIIAGNHDVELLAQPVAEEWNRQLAAVGATDAVLARIRLVPWFVYVPGTAWIEHGHVYDEGCSFEHTLAPFDPKDGRLLYNTDYAATRYLTRASPDLDPHGIESWSLWGFMQYAWGLGLRGFGRQWAAYGGFVWSLFRARGLHRSPLRRERRRREHRARLADVAAQGGVPVETLHAIDRLTRTPMTTSTRRIARMLAFDKFGTVLVTAISIVVMLIALPLVWALLGSAVAVVAAHGITRWLGTHMVLSQLPMRSIPQRIRKLVDVPFVVFGHTHDPRWQPLRSGGVYVNTGTWLPALKPGLRRSFTHVLIEPAAHGVPRCEMRQWREGGSQPFDARANLGAGVHTLPGLSFDGRAFPETIAS